jgi:Predicted integral membrane protein (DUF2270)
VIIFAEHALACTQTNGFTPQKLHYVDDHNYEWLFAACYIIFGVGLLRTINSPIPSPSLLMTTDAQQKVSGPLSAERLQPRLRPAPTPETATSERVGQSPAAHMRRMTPAEFNTAMIHFYRGEVQRSNTWRTRLDTTTYWAVFTTGATLSFAFSSASNPHFLIPINSILIAIFLLMEARRYRYYEIWSSRVRIIETRARRRAA